MSFLQIHPDLDEASTHSVYGNARIRYRKPNFRLADELQLSRLVDRDTTRRKKHEEKELNGGKVSFCLKNTESEKHRNKQRLGLGS